MFASIPLIAGSGITPQSIIIFEWFVSRSRLDLPTSLKPPRAVAFIHSFLIIGWFIFLPIVVRNFFLKSASLTMRFLTPLTTSLFMGGILSTFGTHPVSRTILMSVEPCLPITSPGFIASIWTSLKSGMNLMPSWVTPASGGRRASIFLTVWSGSMRLEVSLLTMSFFLTFVETFLMTFSSPYIAATFLT